MSKKPTLLVYPILILLCASLVGCSPEIKATKTEEKEAIAQLATQSPIATPTQSAKTEQNEKCETAIKSLKDYAQISGLYSEFVKEYSYLDVSLSEDFISEGDSSPCLIVYVYGKEDWCIQTRFNEKGMVSFGVTMPISIAEDKSTIEHISTLLSNICAFYGDEISTDTIKTFIVNNIDDATLEKSTSLGIFKASIAIEDEFITINFTK